jgi:hypothetical protein
MDDMCVPLCVGVNQMDAELASLNTNILAVVGRKINAVKKIRATVRDHYADRLSLFSKPFR